jgi:hypothetical protein
MDPYVRYRKGLIALLRLVRILSCLFNFDIVDLFNSAVAADWQEVFFEIELGSSGSLVKTETVNSGVQRYDFTDFLEQYMPAGTYYCTVQALP